MKLLMPTLTLSSLLLTSVVLTPTPKTAAQGKQSTGAQKIRSIEKRVLRDDNERINWALHEIDSNPAWKISRGNSKIIVAVIDTGADITHPDLAENIWKNPNEIQGNGLDDDQNGLVDDIHGWNFAGWNNDVSDNHGHGTHIAGIIGAKGKNNLGIKGVAPDVSLMILKYYDPNSPGSDSVLREVAAIRYAVRMGAHIINFSAGGLSQSDEEEKAIREANEKGVLVVAAAGNERSNSDVKGFYPADYAIPNILSVTAIDSDREILSSSNYGVRTVDLAAPGREIESTLPGGRYGRLSGTSQATAFATGVAALLIASRRQPLSPEDIIDHLVRTGEPESRLEGKTRGRTRLNSYRALALHESLDSRRIISRHESENIQSFNGL